MSGMEMFRCMFVLRGITAAHVSAGETKPEVDPRVPDFQTIFATSGARFDVVDFIEVFTSGHGIHCSFGNAFWGVKLSMFIGVLGGDKSLGENDTS